MKEFIKAVKCISVCQLIYWGVLFLCAENIFINQSITTTVSAVIVAIATVGLPIFYFWFSEKFIKNSDLKSKKFNLFLFILWFVMSISIAIILGILVDMKYLHVYQETTDSGLLPPDLLSDSVYYFSLGYILIRPAIFTLIVKAIIKIILLIVKSTSKIHKYLIKKSI